jgi:hypothetical protein
MDTASAFAMGDANRGKEMMVFDWDKAAQLIRDSKPDKASAGLQRDWEWTGGTIYLDGAIVPDEYTHLSSTWAVPELCMDGDVVPCYRMESETPGWDCDTKWPDSAKAILAGN